MTAGELIALIISICTILFTAISFILARKKDGYSDGDKDGNLKSDIKYVREGVDDLKLDLKELNRKQDDLNVRLIRVEESAKQAHKRIDELRVASTKNNSKDSAK